jgi:HEAT repeat protein
MRPRIIGLVALSLLVPCVAVLADNKAEYDRLCEIWRKTEPETGKSKGVVTDEEKALLLQELDYGKGDNVAGHDFRRMAALTLGNLKAKEAVAKLIIHLNDRTDEAMVGAEAAKALGKIGDIQAVPALLDALLDDRTWVRRHSADALRSIAPTTDTMKAYATKERFAALIERLDHIPLDIPVDEWRNGSLGNNATHTGQEIAALCEGLNLLKSVDLPQQDRDRAAKLAQKLLAAPFLISDRQMEYFPDLCTFCQTYQPELYSQRIKPK